jgi:hypothetical protein
MKSEPCHRVQSGNARACLSVSSGSLSTTKRFAIILLAVAAVATGASLLLQALSPPAASWSPSPPQRLGAASPACDRVGPIVRDGAAGRFATPGRELAQTDEPSDAAADRPMDRPQPGRPIEVLPGEIHPNVELTAFSYLHFTGRVVATAKGTVSGRVVDASGTPVSSMGVSLCYKASRGVACVPTDVNGCFAFQSVVFGHIDEWSGGRTSMSYNISIMATGYEWFCGPDISCEQSGIVVRLQPECVLSGVVVQEADSAPVPYAWIRLDRGATSDPACARGERAGEDGGFVIGGLGPGEYRIDVRKHPRHFAVIPHCVWLSRGSIQWIVLRVR